MKRVVATLVCLEFILVGPLPAQQVLLDAPVEAGELTVYPTLGPNLEPGTDYYYVPNQAHLAEDERGRPQFSFLRYVENVRPGEGEETAREGEGGGIVHAVVQLDVEPSQLRAAEAALSRVRPGARIVGPVVYRSGTFGLVSSFRQENGDLTRQVVGLGSAPVLEGSRAAISMRLTKLGSKILWESFEMAQPDISFEFEMEMAGLRAPIRARLEADWDRIYRHQAFQAGVAGTLLAGEVSAAFDDLRDSGAIRLVQVGEDAEQAKMVQVAYDKLATLMLEPVQGTGMPSLGQLAGQAGGGGLLDRASKMLQAAREEAGKAEQVARAARPAAADRPAAERPERPAADAPATDNPDPRADEPAADDADGEKPETPDAPLPANELRAGDMTLAPSSSDSNPDEPAAMSDAVPSAESPALSCSTRLAYWTAAETERVEEMRRLLATRLRPYLEHNLPAEVAAAQGQIAGLPASADRRAHEEYLDIARTSLAHWTAYVEAVERWIPAQQEALARDRRRIEPAVYAAAEADPQVAELGRARAQLTIDRDAAGWTDEMALRFDLFEAVTDNPGPAAREKFETLSEGFKEAQKKKEARHQASQREAARLENAVGLFAPFQADECPEESPEAVAEPTDNFLDRGVDVEPLPPVSELLGETTDGETTPDRAAEASGDGQKAANDGDSTPGADLRLVEDPAAAGSIGENDLWIASLGDSFSSGEGNPTTTGMPINAWKWMDDEKCHRSKWGWPHVVADIATEHLQRPVYFSFLACSGGELGAGLLRTFDARNIDRAPQLDRLARLIETAGRVPDVVLLTGGGNDMGFADIVTECISPGNCPGGAATDSLMARMARLDGPDGRFDSVAARLDAMKIPRDHVVLMLYPNPLFGRKRAGSGWGSYEVQSGCYIPAGPRMWTWASDSVVVPLQELQRERAQTLGWRLADNHLLEFEKHSYCPRDSFRGGDSWWVGILSEIVKQWGLGAFHPNRRGHRELARSALLEIGKFVPGMPQLKPRTEASVFGAAVSGAEGGGRGGPGGPGGAGAGGAGAGGGASASKPSFAVVAALQLRKVRQRGTFELDMSKYMAGSQVIAFDEPIGDLSRYKGDDQIFREVNLDQPLFRQREVAFQLDGLNAADFGQYVNFVNVQLRRGADVREELTVRRDEFNERGNDFRLIYGFSGQESRDEWMRFEYRTVWSLFNGLTVEEPWETTQAGAVALAPPYVRRTVELEGDPVALEGVRAVTAHLYYAAGDEERFSELTLRPGRGETVGTADVLLPPGETEYEYEITWIYGNNRSETTGRQRTSNPILYLDPPRE